MPSVVEFLINHWGDLASVFGVAVSLIGFMYTLKQVARSKEAAQRAEQASLSTRAKILMADTVMDLSSAIAIMEENQTFASQWRGNMADQKIIDFLIRLYQRTQAFGRLR